MRPIQKVQRGGYSICPQCAHRNVCIAIDNQPCTECNQFLGERNTVTNADRIRAMDDELLATQLTQVFHEGVTALTEKEIPDNLLNEVRAQILEKLKQPAEGDA